MAPKGVIVLTSTTRTKKMYLVFGQYTENGRKPNAILSLCLFTSELNSSCLSLQLLPNREAEKQTSLVWYIMNENVTASLLAKRLLTGNRRKGRCGG